MRPLSALRYPGGKNANSSTGTGRWVASLLPADVHSYVEPFCGMLGVLLQRKPVTNEVVNDLDCDVVNWWRVVRHQPEALMRAVERIPLSRVEHAEACCAIDNRPPDRRLTDMGDVAWAVDYTICLSQAYAGVQRTWAVSTTGRRSPTSHRFASKIPALADRLRGVMLECGDAIGIIETHGASPGALFYVDPPYPDSTDEYACSVDQDRLDAALLFCESLVAVSGVPGNRPALEAAGWLRHDRSTFRSMGNMAAAGETRPQAVECLWTNFEPPGQTTLL